MQSIHSKMQKQGGLPVRTIVVIILILIVLVVLMLFATGVFQEVFKTISEYLGVAKGGTEPLKQLP